MIIVLATTPETQALNEYQKSQSQITILHELKIASLLSCCFYLCNTLHKTTFILLLRFVESG